MVKILVKLPLWRSEGLVLVGGTYKDFKKYALKHCNLDFVQELEDAAGFAYTENPNNWLVWLDNGRDLPELAHEAFHVTSNLLRHRGVVLSNDSEESFAYTLTDIIEQILAGIKKHK